MSKNIKISPKYGVNPSITVCPVCKKETGIALMGKMKGDVEAPKFTTGSLCDECSKTYVPIYEADPSKKKNNLTGRVVYVKRENVSETYRNREALFMPLSDFQQLLN